MRPDTLEIELDPDKKDYITRAALDKMLKDIKTLLQRNKKIKITIVSE